MYFFGKNKKKLYEENKETIMLEEDILSDELLKDIIEYVIRNCNTVSTSLLQRKFKIGYNKAATMIDMLEENGIIGPPTGNSKPREVLVQFSEDMEEEE